MATPRRQRSRQGELFARSARPMIALDENHRLVLMTREIDWTELEELVQAIRMSKLKSEAGRPPHLRVLIGALVFRATRKMTYRESEEQIRHYAPARYLCGLTETDWTPDANTIQDFEELLGEDGIHLLNERVVKWAVNEKLADPTVVVADTTAQEAAIPYPNEMGLMATFVTAVTAASKRAGGALKGFLEAAGGYFTAAKKKVREYWLFAKEKTKAVKNRMVAEMATVIERVQSELHRALEQGAAAQQRLHGYGSSLCAAGKARSQRAPPALVHAESARDCEKTGGPKRVCPVEPGAERHVTPRRAGVAAREADPRQATALPRGRPSGSGP